MALQSMSWFSGFFNAGYLLNKLATKAKLSLGLPRTTSVAVTNCLHPRRSACSSINSARLGSSFSWRTPRRVTQLRLEATLDKVSLSDHLTLSPLMSMEMGGTPSSSPLGDTWFSRL